MKLCEYGCGQEAKYQFKNGKWCCSKSYNSCPFQRKKIEKIWKDPNSKYNSSECKEKQSNTMKELRKDPNSKYNSSECKEKRKKIFNSIEYKKKRSNIIKEIWKDPNSIYNSPEYKEKQKFDIENINEKYPLFSKIENMRYNPDKPEEKEIQVHCKNHECKNSKEKHGWFAPTKAQLFERINTIENPMGFGESNFYCSQHCKDTCILYRNRSDPYKENNKPYTSGELDVFNKHILKRDNEICYYCNKHHATIVHHRRPQKLEPFFALDPDYAISVCAKCHYKYGHPTGSDHSTGNLAKIVCSVESQKFLNQAME